jgi:YVTN family beta-propeller protein
MRRLFACGLLALAAGSLQAQEADAGYLVGVVSESGDMVTWIKPGSDTLTIDRTVGVGIMPADIDGPHNLAVSPDNRFYYVTIAHGQPFGTLWQMDALADTLVGRATVELFPTTIALTPKGGFAFVANSDFHGDHPRVNQVSVVHTPTMTKITDLPLCDMPHGVKANHAGTRVYVSCMHSDEIVELDVATFDVLRRAKVGGGHAMAGTGHAPPVPSRAIPAGRGPEDECAATFVSVSPDDATLYVACNTRSTVQVWDAASLTLRKEVHVGKGAYNVEPSPDGRYVIVTNKKEQSISLLDAATLEELARIPTTKPIVHGIAFSPDHRYAYISCESIGSDPGAVDMVDLERRAVVASVPVPAQPTGIAIWQRVTSN